VLAEYIIFSSSCLSTDTLVCGERRKGLVGKREMQTIQGATEDELSKMTIAQLRAICVEVGVQEGRNCRLTAQALKAAEVKPGASDGSSSEEDDENSLPGGEVESLGNLMKKVLKELTSLKHKVNAISTAPSKVSNIEQLNELHNKLVRERMWARGGK
jgi:hypothetical protein